MLMNRLAATNCSSFIRTRLGNLRPMALVLPIYIIESFIEMRNSAGNHIVNRPSRQTTVVARYQERTNF
jgi:hypothetical protein